MKGRGKDEKKEGIRQAIKERKELRQEMKTEGKM